LYAIGQDFEPELKRLFGNVADLDLLLNADFEQQCQELLQPVWNALHD
jgi:exodeoxyribonuclease V gamma subunit